MTSPAPLEVEAWVNLKKVYHVFSRLLQHKYSQLDLTSAQYLVLRHLTDGPSTATALAEKIGVTIGNLTGVIDRLEAAGLIERNRRSDDRRSVTLVLTDAGRAQAEVAIREMRGYARELFTPLASEELRVLHAALGKLVAGLPELETREVLA